MYNLKRGIPQQCIEYVYFISCISKLWFYIQCLLILTVFSSYLDCEFMFMCFDCDFMSSVSRFWFYFLYTWNMKLFFAGDRIVIVFLAGVQLVIQSFSILYIWILILISTSSLYTWYIRNVMFFLLVFCIRNVMLKITSKVLRSPPWLGEPLRYTCVTHDHGYVFTVWVPYCDVRYDFRIITIFGSSLLPVVCRGTHVLFTLFVFVWA